MSSLDDHLEELLGARPSSLAPLHTSDWAEVICAEMPGGEKYAVKLSRDMTAGMSETEARMLRYLAANSALPVPDVIAASPRALVLEYVEGGDTLDAAAERDAARHMALLHDLSAPEFGLEFDTLFGSAHQPNACCASWIEFFRDRRLLYMAGLASRAGRLEDAMLGRVKELADKLEDLIEEPTAPSLLHGDLWQGNLLVRGGRIAAFIDPAIYYGHAEMDLAFSTLFGTLSEPFFDAYQEQRPIAAGFFEQRRDLYNLWPLLGHVLFFGGSYLGQVDAILRRHNF